MPDIDFLGCLSITYSFLGNNQKVSYILSQLCILAYSTYSFAYMSMNLKRLRKSIIPSESMAVVRTTPRKKI